MNNVLNLQKLSAKNEIIVAERGRKSITPLLLRGMSTISNDCGKYGS